MKKKILIVMEELNIGGVEKSLINLLNSIDYNNYEIDLMLKSKEGLLFKYVPKEVSVIYKPIYFDWVLIPRKKTIIAIIKSIGFNFNFFRLIYFILWGFFKNNMGQARQKLWESSKKTFAEVEKKYDVAIDYHGLNKNFINDKVRANKKITWIHSDYKKFGRNKTIDYKDYSTLDIIVTVSETVKEIFIKEFPEFVHKVFLLHNITNKSQIVDMSKENVDYDDNYGGTKILDVARLDSFKGIDIAIQACKILVEKKYDLKWYIVGDGKDKKNIKKMIKSNDLQDKFILLGATDNPYPYIRKSDLIVHCSLFEGKSVFIDEAKLLSKPIILTNYPTAKDQIENNVNGIICDISAEAVAKSVEELLINPRKRNGLINNLENFDIPIEDSLNKFYYLVK